MFSVSGYTIVRNGILYDYPFRESIASLLPLVDELIIAVGDSCDRTLEIIRSIESPKIRIIETEWNPTLRHGGAILAQQSNLALKECKGDWCFYLQADEVIHENDADKIYESMRRFSKTKRVEGIRFRYHHFRADYSIVDPIPYRHQIRIIRNHQSIVSVGDACGFARLGRKLKSKNSKAWIYHYGYVRPPNVLARKTCYFESLYQGRKIEPGREPDVGDFNFDLSRCRRFKGQHPACMEDRIRSRDWQPPAFNMKPIWLNVGYYYALVYKNTRAIRRWAKLIAKPFRAPRTT